MHAHAHTHTHMHTNPHAHVRTFTYTHTGVMLQSQTCAYVHIKMALAVIHHTHTCTHTHMHTHTCTHTHIHRTGLCFVKLLSNFPVVSCFYEHIRCEPALQECTLMHTGMHAQTHPLTQTNKHTHIHKCKPPTLHSAWYTHTCTSTIRACWSLITSYAILIFFSSSAPVWFPLMYPWPPLDAHVP